MTPVNIDLQDLARRMMEAAVEAAAAAVFGPPTLSKTPAPAVTDAKKQKAKDEAERLRALHLVKTHQAQILKQLEVYKKQLHAETPIDEPAPKTGIYRSLDARNMFEQSLTWFCPYLVPFKEIAKSLPELRPFGLDLSWAGLREGLTEFNRRADENRAAFKKSIEGAIWNPTSLEELAKGNLFVIEAEALNEIVSTVISKGPAAKKLRNVHIEIDGDRLKIKGEYKTALMWVDFSAQLEFEQKDGETSGSLKKIEAVGIDLGDCFKTDILQAFGQFGFAPPEDAELKDLSWIQLPGIKRLEITRDKIILEREPAPDGPS